MKRFGSRVVAVMLASGVALPNALAADCKAARLAEDQPPVGATWRAALEALIEATSRPGRPWSCGGAILRLEVDERAGVGELRVEDEHGRGRDRLVEAPDELVPTGEALLATPLAFADLRARTVKARVGPAESWPEPARAAGPTPPRFALEIALNPRFAAPTRVLWMSGELRATLPIYTGPASDPASDAFSVGVWARAATAAYLFDPVPEDFTMSEESVGLTAGRRLLRAPLELDVTFDPSLAVVSMEGGPEITERGGSKIDVRLGTSLRALVPLGTRWRMLVAGEVEAAPAGFSKSASRRIDPTLPLVPAFAAGLALGFQVLVR